jgi:hypothetical protein
VYVVQIGDFTVYFGASSGSSRKVLREMKEPDVMINYATRDNKPFDTIDRLFTDSGGYSFMHNKGEYTTTNRQYLEYVETHQPEVWALRDYPCEPDILEKHGRTVEDHQNKTTNRHRHLMDLKDDYDIDGEPMAVLQGWGPYSYERHIDGLQTAGVLTDIVGVGSVCRRNATEDILEILHRVNDALPQSTKMHAFGVKTDVLREDIPPKLVSVDTHSYDYRARYYCGDHYGGRKTWRDVAYHYTKQRDKLKRALYPRFGGG